MSDALDLTHNLGGQWHGAYGTAPCPVCQQERRKDQNALTLTDGPVGVLVHCKKSECEFRDIMGLLGFAGSDYRRVDTNQLAQRQATRELVALRKEAAARRLWAEAVPIEGTPAEAYLRTVRCITCPLPATLRFHRAAYHGPTRQRIPAIIAEIQGTENFAVHRTFLRSDGLGKANLPGGDKLMLGSMAGGAVWLSEGYQRIVIAEGIETGLSLACGLLSEPASILAALSTSGMRNLHLPPTPARLTIAQDGDQPGRDAAYELALRAHALGWAVSLLDPGDGKDFNDVLLGRTAG